MTQVHVPRTTSWQQNAAAFATTPVQAFDAERNATRGKVLQLLADGMPGRAQYELNRSVIRQARIAGLGTVDLAVPCPCGGRCSS